MVLDEELKNLEPKERADLKRHFKGKEVLVVAEDGGYMGTLDDMTSSFIYLSGEVELVGYDRKEREDIDDVLGGPVTYVAIKTGLLKYMMGVTEDNKSSIRKAVRDEVTIG